MIEPVAQLRSMQAYALADLHPQLQSLAQNESFLPVSPRALRAGQLALQQSALYPDPDWSECRAALADAYSVAGERIVCGTGSMELIAALLRAYVAPDQDVVGSQYGYAFVATVCQQIGARYLLAPEPSLMLIVDAILNCVTANTRVVFVCNPGNPTGTRIANSEIIRLRDALDDSILLIVDQAYGEFDPQDHQSVFALTDRANTAITRTLSKAYCLAGQRVGWSVLHESMAADVRKLINPNNVTGVAQAMASAAVQDQAHLRFVVESTAAQRQALVQQLPEQSLHLPLSYTNFQLLQFASTQLAGRVDQSLRQSGLLLRPVSGSGLPDCLRVTIGTAAQMQQVASTIDEVLS